MPSFTVTLTNADTDYDLLTLVRDQDAEFVDGGRHLTLQNTHTTATIRVARGDSAANGYHLLPGEGQVYTVGKGRHVLMGLKARSSVAGGTLVLDVTR